MAEAITFDDLRERFDVTNELGERLPADIYRAMLDVVEVAAHDQRTRTTSRSLADKVDHLGVLLAAGNEPAQEPVETSPQGGITFDDLRENTLFFIDPMKAASWNLLNERELFSALVDVAKKAARWEGVAIDAPRSAYPERTRLLTAARRLRDLMQPKPCRHHWFFPEDGRSVVVCDRPGCDMVVALPEVGDAE